MTHLRIALPNCCVVLLLSCGQSLAQTPPAEPRPELPKVGPRVLPGVWPQYRGPERNGISRETKWTWKWPAEGPKVLWRKNVGWGFACFAIVDDRLYAIGDMGDPKTQKKADIDEVVSCLDAVTGKEHWKYSYKSQFGQYPGTYATPLVYQGRVFTTSRLGLVHCLDTENGKVIWSKNILEDVGRKVPNYGYAVSPLVCGDSLIWEVGNQPNAASRKTAQGSVAAFAIKDGQRLWITGSETAGYSSANYYEKDGRLLVVVFSASALLGIDPIKHEVIWRVPYPMFDPQPAAMPIVSEKRIFFSACYGGHDIILDVAANKPEVIYDGHAMQNHVSTCVLWEGHLYGFKGKRQSIAPLVCISFEDGAVKWTQDKLGPAPLDKFGKSQLTVAAGKLIILDESGLLIIAEASPQGYKELARAKVLDGPCWVTPVLANGRIYCKNNMGDMACVDVSEK